MSIWSFEITAGDIYLTFFHLMSRDSDVDKETNPAGNSHALYQLLVDWYGTTSFHRPLSSSELTNQWTTESSRSTTDEIPFCYRRVR